MTGRRDPLRSAPRVVWMLLACWALLVAPSFAQSSEPGISSLAQALDRLGHADPRQRVAAVSWLGQHGGEADAARLAPRLHDEDALVRALAEKAIWLMWTRSGDTAIDRLFSRGLEQMNAGDLKAAIATFDEIVRRKPAFAEGWNRRATARYLAGDYRNALADCDEVVRRNPLHFGALSGYGLIYLKLAEYDRALEYFRRALAVNPNMEGVLENIRALEEMMAQRRRRST